MFYFHFTTGYILTIVKTPQKEYEHITPKKYKYIVNSPNQSPRIYI